MDSSVIYIYLRTKYSVGILSRTVCKKQFLKLAYSFNRYWKYLFRPTLFLKPNKKKNHIFFKSNRNSL